MKKIIICVVVLFVLGIMFDPCKKYKFAYAVDNPEQELKEETASQLDELDFDDIQGIVDRTDTSSIEVFSNFSFEEIVSKIVNGEITFKIGNFFNYILTALKNNLQKCLPTFALLIAVVLLCAISSKAKPNMSENGVGNVIFFACFSIVIVIVAGLMTTLIIDCTESIISIKKQMQIIFPILLTLMTSVGAVSSVKIYQPAVAILSSGVASIFIAFLLPLFSIGFVFCIVGNLSTNVKLDKYSDLINSIFKWTIGIVFAIFMAYLAIQGMTASSVDGVSIRTAKYAIKNYVPVLGGYISEGFEVVMASSLLLKNGIGLASVFLLFSTIICPILNILVLSLGLKLVAAVTQPICDNKFTTFFSSCSQNLIKLVAILLGAGLMYFLTIALFIGTANGLV